MICRGFFPSLSARLTRLCADKCDFIGLDTDCLQVLTQLKLLEMNDCFNCEKVNINVLVRLEYLVIRTSSSQHQCPSLRHLSTRTSLRVLELRLLAQKSSYSVEDSLIRALKLPTLTHLDVETTGSVVIDKYWFSGFPSLKSLKLLLPGSAARSDLPILSVLTHLETISLSRNNLNSLKECRLQQLSYLKCLDLSYNSILINCPDVFWGLLRLTSLDLSYNSITSIHPKAFHGLVNLLKLDLSCNRVSSLEPGQFAYLRSLEHLDMSVNEISEMNAESFEGLSKLKKLVLCDNRIENVPDKAFSFLSSLESVNLATNRFKSERKTNEIKKKLLPIEIIF